MSSSTVDDFGVGSVPSVGAVGSLLRNLMVRAESVKGTTSLEPPLDQSDFNDLQGEMTRILGPIDTGTSRAAERRRSQRFAIIETAARGTLYSLIVSCDLIGTASTDSPAFAKVWNLFDILSFLSDSGQCDPALLLWLVEELLDSQTITGCRKVFDFLESRRERITAKNFGQKKLIILRACNELLRRLSRALDPAFCGRVFIFMFQSFPLGDKSSVNLRGEYHVENVTTFDRAPPTTDGSPDKMDVDPVERTSKGTEGKKNDKEAVLDPDDLYPIFWSLQESFSQPRKLFVPAHFASFKAALESTMATFKSIKAEPTSRSREKLYAQIEENKDSLKRKRDDEDDELAGSFNPKYLTSRDLFKLEISDLPFRRNILVQALIVMEFLLGLSPKAKEKLNSIKAPNRSVTYLDEQMNADDIKWVLEMKKTIAEYLRQGPEGPYFYRMVETVLARDKNWVRWKSENCPSIELPPVSAETFAEATRNAGKAAATKRLRAAPMGSLSLDFLDDSGDMEPFKTANRYTPPTLAAFKQEIGEDDFELGMATDNQTKAAIAERKASKAWRALRIASKSRLAAFDKLESDENIDSILDDNASDLSQEATDGTDGNVILPEDPRPIIFVDAAGGESQLIPELITKYPGTFTKVPEYVTRTPEEGESSGKAYHFVDSKTFNLMRDQDHFLAFIEDGDQTRGVKRRDVESISDSHRVPVIEANRDIAQQVKDWEFEARRIFIRPPSPETHEEQLKRSGLSDGKLQEALKAATEAAEQASTLDLYDCVVDGDITALESVVFGAALKGTADHVASEAADGDIAMDGAV